MIGKQYAEIWPREITTLLSYLYFDLQVGKLCNGQELHTAFFLLHSLCIVMEIIF